MAMSDLKSVRTLALSILNRKRDSTWDSGGTVAQKLSQSEKPAGTAKVEPDQAFNPAVPLSHALGTGTVGQLRKSGTVLGTPAGQPDVFPYAETLDQLDRCRPEYIEADRWQQCLIDAQRFLA
jgi:hypothetical protein